MSGYIFLDVNYNTAYLTSVSSSPANCNWFSHCYYGTHCYPGESFSLHLPSPMPSHAPEKPKAFITVWLKKCCGLKQQKVCASHEKGNRCGSKYQSLGHGQSWSVEEMWGHLLHFFHCSSLLGKALRQDIVARSQQPYLGYLAQGLEQNGPLWPHQAASPPRPSTSQQRGYRDLRSGETRLTNIEGVAVEKMLVWPTRAVGLLC